MDRIDCAVIGAGVVGLAVARALARAGREVIVLEAAETIGTGASSRNSEVIHAGIYYPAGSLKARLCVKGRDMLYAYLGEHGIEHQRCGKLIIATNDEETALLGTLLKTGRGTGGGDLEWLHAAAVRGLEPLLRCRAALKSPSTGILDSHAFMLSLQGEAEGDGAAFAFHSPVAGGRADGERVTLAVGGTDPMRLSCRLAVNCAGLAAQNVAAAVNGLAGESIPPLHLAKGSYFLLFGKAPFKHLIYPLPGAASLGIHYTRDLSGQGRFGPDVEWVEEIDFTIDDSRVDGFYEAIRRYWPGLKDGALRPGYSGIRPKIQRPGEAPADFVIQGPAVHGVKGLINLYGIESPGLTAALAIAEEVAALLA